MVAGRRGLDSEEIMNTRLTYSFLAVLLVIFGWFAGSRQPVKAQAGGTICEWRMFSENVDGMGSTYEYSSSRAIYGTSWMYHSCSGEVRRMFDGCGDTHPNGCALTLPILRAATSLVGFQPNMKMLVQ